MTTPFLSNIFWPIKIQQANNTPFDASWLALSFPASVTKNGTKLQIVFHFCHFFTFKIATLEYSHLRETWIESYISGKLHVLCLFKQLTDTGLWSIMFRDEKKCAIDQEWARALTLIYSKNGLFERLAQSLAGREGLYITMQVIPHHMARITREK